MIAASTTSTGRELLEYAKKFIEDIYNKIIKFIIQGKIE
jgi:hypothetical protein